MSKIVKTKGPPWLSRLYRLFTKQRKAAKQCSSKEINKDIKKAIRAVRKK